MRIDTIKIENFRCFENYEISFAEKTTVLIGKNGTGKSNLLTAIVYSLSFPFAKNKIPGVQTIATSSPDLKIAAIDNKGHFDARYDDMRNDYIYPLKLINQGFFNGEPLGWSMVKERKEGSILPSLYKDAFEKFQNYYSRNSPDKPLPILAFFADSFPHIEANISGYAQSVLSGNGTPRNFGYYKWDEKNNCIGIWRERYIAKYSSLNNFKRPDFDLISKLNGLQLVMEKAPDHKDYFKWENEASILRKELADLNAQLNGDPEYQEINFIDSKLKKFTETVNDNLDFINEEFQIDEVRVIGTNKTEQKIQILFKDGRKIFFDNLPMGYKRLFSIVFDIAYRSLILNKTTEPTGIVIIDEVELHLHPTLQMEVMQRFRKTFPEIQFIVSTHSPLIISNLKLKDEYGNNRVIKLVNEAGVYTNETIENIYGIDYTTNLIEIMETGYRPSTIDKLINTYLVLYGKQKDRDADIVLDKLKNYLGGSIPELLQKEIDNQKRAYKRQ